MAKIEDLNKLSDDQLEKKLVELREQQLNLRFQKVSGQVEDTSQIRKVRREIAQVKTLRAQRKSA